MPIYNSVDNPAWRPPHLVWMVPHGTAPPPPPHPGYVIFLARLPRRYPGFPERQSQVGPERVPGLERNGEPPQRQPTTSGPWYPF